MAHGSWLLLPCNSCRAHNPRGGRAERVRLDGMEVERRWPTYHQQTTFGARARTRPSLPPKESEKKEEKNQPIHTHTHTLEESVTLHVSVLYPRLRIWSMWKRSRRKTTKCRPKGRQWRTRRERLKDTTTAATCVCVWCVCLCVCVSVSECVCEHFNRLNRVLTSSQLLLVFLK